MTTACNILITLPDMTQALAGIVFLVGDRVQARAKPQYRTLMQNVMAGSNFNHDGPRLVRSQNPKAWFKALPATYNGSRVRAEIKKSVNAFNPDEARDDKGRWTEGSDNNPIPRSDYPLTDKQRAVETKFRNAIAKDPEGFKAEYRRKYGNELNADNAKELSEDYGKDRTNNALAVHEPASWLVKQMYKEELAKDPEPGKANLVFFTAGGAGAGKSRSLASHDSANDISKVAQIVYDGTMRPASAAIKKIDQALDAGKNVVIGFIDRPADKALVGGVLPRAAQIGRTLPIEEMAHQYSTIRDSMAAIKSRYAKDARVGMFTIQNHGTPEEARMVPLEHLPPSQDSDFENLKSRLHHLLDREYENGNVTEAIYKATKGTGSQAKQIGM